MAAALSETPDDHLLSVLTSQTSVTHYRVQRDDGVYVLDGAAAGSTKALSDLVDFLRAQGNPPLTIGCLGLTVRCDCMLGAGTYRERALLVRCALAGLLHWWCMRKMLTKSSAPYRLFSIFR